MKTAEFLMVPEKETNPTDRNSTEDENSRGVYLVLGKQRKLVLAFTLFYIVLLCSATFVTHGFPSFSNSCSVSGCHDDATGMTITISSLVIDVNVSGTFSLNISSVGKIGKFPSELVDNSKFVYIGLDTEGTVQDGDLADQNPVPLMITIEYSLIAPEIPGTYTLLFFAVKYSPFSNSTYIQVNVIDTSISSSPIPSTSSISPSSPPTFPWINLYSIFSVNFLFTWGFLILFFIGIVFVVDRKLPRDALIYAGILMSTFGMANFYQYGFDVLSASLTTAGLLLISYINHKSKRKQQSESEIMIQS